MIYTLREKVFPDGLLQAFHYNRLLQYGEKKGRKKKGGPAAHGSGLTVEQKEIENMKRAKQMVWDLARSNYFEWWVTLTVSPETGIDRYDYRAVAGALTAFTKHLGKHVGRWIFVPDTHEDGAIHFHGLMAADVPMVRAVNPYTGEELFDKSGRPVYNIPGYKLGFTSAVPLDGCYDAVVNYLTAYYTKNRKMIVPKGCKRYWASRNLARPTVDRALIPEDVFMREYVAQARHVTAGENRFFKYIMAEVQTDGYRPVWSDDLPDEWKEDTASTDSTQQNKNNT